MIDCKGVSCEGGKKWIKTRRRQKTNKSRLAYGLTLKIEIVRFMDL